MLLKKLEIYGFKSFADRIEIEFDKGITAIVGPNGSGKSNVADAVRWVLGEQSAKSLRGNKMEDIIFSGTQVRKPLGFAEVSLTLDNTDESLPVDFSEVTITRRVFRSGESEYYINRSSCRLKDITELFMDTGVGKEGYSIIGQGRIEEILSTHPENRRQIFEEAAGIVKYKTRKQESERKLERTQENILRVEDILREIEHQLKPLEEQSRVAREYLSLRDRLKFYELNRFVLEYDSNKKKIDKIKENLSLLDGDIENHKKSIGEEEIKGGNLAEKLTGLDSQIQSIRDNRYNTLNEIEKLKGKTQVTQERIAQLGREKSRLEEEIGEEKKAIIEKEKEKSIVINKLEERKGAQEEALLKSSQLESRLEAIQRELSSSYAKVQEKKDRMMEIWNSLSEAKNSITRYETLKMGLEEQRLRINDQLEELKDSRIALTRKQDDTKESIKGLEEMLQSKGEEKAVLKEKIASLEGTVKGLDNKLQLQRQQLEGDKSKLKLLVDMAKTYDGFQKTVKNILMACQTNSAIGERVCGVVAELIEVPKEYEVAIETALGASLQHIVTHNEENAKYIIEFLRQRRLGRATFLPISSIKGRDLNNQEKMALNMEGCLGRGVDLIGFDPKFENIFNNLLGRVIVTKNLDQAIAIAKRFSYSFRIVTLEGDLVNTGGSMTGGSLNRRNVGIIGRGREIDALKGRISQLVKEMESSSAQRKVYSEEYAKLSHGLKGISGEVHELEIQLATGKEHLESTHMEIEKADREIQDLEQAKAKLAQDIMELESTIGKQKKLIAELKSQDEDIKAMVDSTDSSIGDINRQKEEVDQEITNVKIHIAELRHGILSLKERLEQLGRDIQAHGMDIERKSKALEANHNLATKYRQEAKDHKNCIEELDVQAKEAEERLNLKQLQKEELAEEMVAIEKRIKDLNSIVDEIRERKHSLDVQLSRAEMELENSQNNIWEEYEVSYAHAQRYRDENLSVSQIRKEIQEIKQRIDELGNINVNAIEEYRDVKERYDFLTLQKGDLINAKDNLQGIIRDITTTMEEKFAEEFAIINQHFNHVFRRLFGGGKAELVLEDKDDVLTSGIEIVAQPPGKKLQSISLFSGGEKTLTAIAILFAILEHKPTPFCVLDEIEAALDENNVQSFGRFLKEFSEDTQFLLITHRRGTMENSDVLYGVTMEEKGVSRMISVKLEDEIAS